MHKINILLFLSFLIIQDNAVLSSAELRKDEIQNLYNFRWRLETLLYNNNIKIIYLFSFGKSKLSWLLRKFLVCLCPSTLFIGQLQYYSSFYLGHQTMGMWLMSGSQLQHTHTHFVVNWAQCNHNDKADCLNTQMGLPTALCVCKCGQRWLDCRFIEEDYWRTREREAERERESGAFRRSPLINFHPLHLNLPHSNTHVNTHSVSVKSMVCINFVQKKLHPFHLQYVAEKWQCLNEQNWTDAGPDTSDTDEK